MASSKANKERQKKRKDQETNENEGEDKNYVRWSLQMDQALADIMRDERQRGNKGDGGWKKVAYNTAASILTAQFNTYIIADNVRNRVKTWKKFYGIVSDILSQSGFTWDATSKMITVDSEHAWEEYVQSHKEAKSFRFKVIANWEDIVDLCGKDRATGHGAETGVEGTQFMTLEDDHIVELDGDTEGVEGSPSIDDILPNSMGSQKKTKQPPSTDIPPPKKRTIGTKDVLANSVAKMASSFQEFIQASASKLDPMEVYVEVNTIPDLSRDEKIKAYAWLIENEKQFLMLKAVPIEVKKDMILMFLSSKA